MKFFLSDLSRISALPMVNAIGKRIVIERVDVYRIASFAGQFEPGCLASVACKADAISGA